MQNQNFLQSSQCDLLATRAITAGAEVNDTNPVRRISNLNCTPNLFLRPHPIRVCCTIYCTYYPVLKKARIVPAGWGGRMPCSLFLWLIRKHVVCFRLCSTLLSLLAVSLNRLRAHATWLSIFRSRPVSHCSRKAASTD